MRTSSNPVFRNLPKESGYAGFGGAPAQPQYGQYPQPGYPQQPGYQQAYPAQTRAITIDDVVTKTAITLGTLIVSAVISYVLVANNTKLALPFALVGALVGLVLVLVASFGNQSSNPAIVLGYAVAEGLFLGSLSFVFTDITFGGVGGAGLIGQAVLGTLGVFAGMLVAYRTGAIRVTPKLTRMIVGATVGVLVLMVGNLIASFFMADGFGLRSGGPLAIAFSLVCIGIAAFNFLIDFDTADQLIRAQAPEKMAWAVALGLTVTLVWLYVEILRLLSYFNND
ncbi:MAG: hypothetical protein HOQ24_03075 [Mycobacteriaceae bacterium]|nr:hypothetical protein [Mycobacteriaceae bacterium]